MTERTPPDAPFEAADAKAGDGDEEGLQLYSDPFAGRGICAKARALPAHLRKPVTQACPRCGDMRDPTVPLDERPCLLEGVALDVLALEAEDDLHDIREQLGGPLEF